MTLAHEILVLCEEMAAGRLALIPLEISLLISLPKFKLLNNLLNSAQIHILN